MSPYLILIEHVVIFSPLREKRRMVFMFFVLLLVKGKYFAKGQYNAVLKTFLCCYFVKVTSVQQSKHLFCVLSRNKRHTEIDT